MREIECATDSEVHAAVARARAAQRRWQEIGIPKRVAIVRKFQHGLHERKSEIARLITQEAGKPYVEAV